MKLLLTIQKIYKVYQLTLFLYHTIIHNEKILSILNEESNIPLEVIEEGFETLLEYEGVISEELQVDESLDENDEVCI